MYGITLNSERKGNILDIPILMIILMVVAVSVIITYKVLVAFDESVQANDQMPQVAKDLSSQGVGWFDDFWNKAFFVIYIGLTLASVVSAFFVDTHPIFFFIFIILMVVFVFVAAMMSDVMIAIFGTAELTTISDNFGTIQNFFAFFPVYILVSCALIIVAMVVRPKEAYY